ncbi:MAG: ribulose-phosphate 3-epimerase [Gammaproteobacteria bacterium GWE2_42_36]|nr:MAG: ribulose-phosphate 3-epimerase [Gammaproteobacteria bacterium GWE2_42_36]HCU05295.1 ribulose-phosphate 3-epimerase [Coxiellaceae bacterium]
MRNYLIAPSILSADFARLGEEVEKVLQAGADWIHVDVMDNHYVPNLTMGPLVCKALRNYGIKAPLDVHLMIEPVDAIIPAFVEAGASMITFHPEASKHVDRTIDLIKKLGCQVGLAFNPATRLDYLDYTLSQLDLILLMTVNPGFGGQSFIPGMIDKIKKTRALIDQSGREVYLAIDGGVSEKNIADIAKAGANVFVAGSAIFGQKDYAETIRTFREKLADL